MTKYMELFNPEFLSRRYEIYAQMRNEDPVYYMDSDFFQSWFITRYDDVSALLNDKRLSTSNTIHYLDLAPEEEQALLSPLRLYMQQSLPETLDERHKVLQTFFLQYLSPKVIASLQESIERMVGDMFDRLDPVRTFNFSEEFAYPLPAMVIADLLGVPASGYDNIIRWSKGLISVFRPYNFEAYKQGQEDMLAMIEYCQRLMRSDDLRNDCLLFALAIEVDKGKISEEEALVNCANMLFAGHETTASALGKGLLEFFKNRDQLALVQQDPALMANAVEEIIRKVGVVGWLARRAKDDFDFKGYSIRKNDRIMLSPFTANLDDRHFENAEAFDIRRNNAKQHLGFGKGKHYCLGASLARMEITIVFTALFERFPDFQIDLDNIETGSVMFLNYMGPQNLPVRLELA